MKAEHLQRMPKDQGHSSSFSGKNLANNGHSSYKCESLAELPEAIVTGNFC